MVNDDLVREVSRLLDQAICSEDCDDPFGPIAAVLTSVFFRLMMMSPTNATLANHLIGTCMQNAAVHSSNILETTDEEELIH